MVYAGTVLLENKNQVNKLELKRRGGGWVKQGKKQLSKGRKACRTNILDLRRCYHPPPSLQTFLKGANGCRGIISRQGHE